MYLAARAVMKSFFLLFLLSFPVWAYEYNYDDGPNHTKYVMSVGQKVYVYNRGIYKIDEILESGRINLSSPWWSLDPPQSVNYTHLVPILADSCRDFEGRHFCVGEKVYTYGEYRIRDSFRIKAFLADGTIVGSWGKPYRPYELVLEVAKIQGIKKGARGHLRDDFDRLRAVKVGKLYDNGTVDLAFAHTTEGLISALMDFIFGPFGQQRSWEPPSDISIGELYQRGVLTQQASLKSTAEIPGYLDSAKTPTDESAK